MMISPEWDDMDDVELAVECEKGIPDALAEWASRHPEDAA